ncbi:hypothetical protein SAMN05216327_11228 [Dyadobacter sp. SG02]|uniref:DUF6934 family protein n=1 Tax=Dyadobacter sp. SG02 TaxID=1855291 RepID=UPI0008B0521D|nr:hypothetical protein [Dyadobacter sp. SG02]SEJ52763.1 hypothetical protein SAMN05216327_11228 [Dyadobacter sp. SG02]
MIGINLEDTYEPVAASLEREVAVMEFYSPQRDGVDELIKVEIIPHPDELLPSVYNLAMGPLGADGNIDDLARLHHQNSNKFFSTIILFSIAFLDEFPDLIIGLDGSNEVRAYLYHSMILTNRNHLADYLVFVGVDWYVKLLRNGDIERMPGGQPYFKPRPEPFDFNRSRGDLYRYYLLQPLP